MSKKAIVIDGNSLVYRAFYATFQVIDYYKSKQMVPVNALKLTMLIILKLLDQKQYDYAFVAFDHHKKTFRNDLMQEYKANRQKTPQDLLDQLPLIKQAVEAMGIVWISKANYEADDLIGSFTNLCELNKCRCDVFSSDKDMLQLVDNNVDVYLFKTGISQLAKHDLNNFADLQNGLVPKQIIDYKAIVGDGSDNFCGVKGIGPKTAIDLLLKYKSLDEIYNHLHELKTGQRDKFIEFKDNAYLCYKIASINKDLFIDTKLEEFVKKPLNNDALENIISQYRFKGFEKWIRFHK